MESGLNTSRAPQLLIPVPVILLAGLIGLVLAIAMIGGGSANCDGGEVAGALSSKVPKKLVPLYEEAAAKYKLGAKGPSVLAGINFVETSVGTNMATSSAGAEGWMAFLPSTFAEWGVDGDGDGVKDIFNAADAIFSAVNYLHDSGAPGNWWKAVFAYNHADWYVEKVLRYAKEFAAGGSGSVEVAAASCEASAAPNEAVAGWSPRPNGSACCGRGRNTSGAVRTARRRRRRMAHSIAARRSRTYSKSGASATRRWTRSPCSAGPTPALGSG